MDSGGEMSCQDWVVGGDSFDRGSDRACGIQSCAFGGRSGASVAAAQAGGGA
jgi:hypothetical protein